MNIYLFSIRFMTLRGFGMGAGLGALYGTLVFPGIGTIFGCVFGALVGVFMGLFLGGVAGLVIGRFPADEWAERKCRISVALVTFMIGLLSATSGFNRLVGFENPSNIFEVLPSVIAACAATYTGQRMLTRLTDEKPKGKKKSPIMV